MLIDLKFETADNRQDSSVGARFQAATYIPIKQACLALLQGDAAGDHLAAEDLGTKPSVDFEMMSMGV